jgi:transaldolase
MAASRHLSLSNSLAISLLCISGLDKYIRILYPSAEKTTNSIWRISMKVFIDSADPEEIKRAQSMGIIDGVTTNPTLIAKTGREFRELIDEILSIVDGPISVEAVSMRFEDIVPEAEKLAEIHRNIVVKIPMTPDGLRAVKILSAEGINTNMTLIFSPNQALLAAKVGATYISPFIGRLDDISHVSMDLIESALKILKNYSFNTQLIVASIRHPIHVLESAKLGAPIVTVPFKVIEQLTKHPLTDIGIERFLQDWKKVQKAEKQGG